MTGPQGEGSSACVCDACSMRPRAVQATRFLALITAALSSVMSVLMVSLGVGFLRE